MDWLQGRKGIYQVTPSSKLVHRTPAATIQTSICTLCAGRDRIRNRRVGGEKLRTKLQFPTEFQTKIEGKLVSRG